MDIFIFILIIMFFIGLAIFMTPFYLKNEPDALITYIWIVFIFLILISANDLFWDYTHAWNYEASVYGYNYTRGIGLFIAKLLLVPIVISVSIVIFMENLSMLILKKFILPFIAILIPIYILFQGFLLFSAYRAYSSAKQMQVKNINKQNMLDFYSPFIKHISVESGEAKRWYRWSYRRGRYVFEVNPSDKYIPNSEGSYDTIYHFPHNQYAKEYKLSIPKAYLVEKKYRYGLEEIIIPSYIDWSRYFYFTKSYINIRSSSATSINSSMNKKLETQYGLQKGIDYGYYHNDNREKYGNNYLTYSSETVLIQCHYLENNITSDTCHMSMLSNGFEYKFNIYKKYISQWKQIKTKLSELFESFIVDVKQYPDTLNPYKE